MLWVRSPGDNYISESIDHDSCNFLGYYEQHCYRKKKLGRKERHTEEESGLKAYTLRKDEKLGSRLGFLAYHNYFSKYTLTVSK